MARLELERVDIEEEGIFISLGRGGEVLLGRGPLLKVDATNISRKQAKLTFPVNTGNVFLTALHKTPIYIRDENTWKELTSGNTVVLRENFEFKFTQLSFHFKVKELLGSGNSDQSHVVNAFKAVGKADETEEEESVQESVSIRPQPTGIKGKKRKLPDWMREGVADSRGTTIKSSANNKATNKKSKPMNRHENDTDINHVYNQNVKFITGQEQSRGPNNAQNCENGSESSLSNKIELSDSEEDTPASALDKSAVAEERNALDVTRTDLEPYKFPVLITPEDLQDSDDEDDKENQKNAKNKPLKKTDDKKEVKKTLIKPSRPSCPYGEACYRKNPAHRDSEAHPGDPDYAAPGASTSADDDRPECEYGTDCYRKNPAHRRDFKHSQKPRPKRKAKDKVKKAKKKDDELDDSFIDDDEEDVIDDTDEDEDWAISSDDE